ncbi:hypothetical protein F511_04160 [Dorcoceras hygrometricum]|uniref:Uncharacterized protein n=1 Tax=Dorcoceras hygrometricum TaxID=472368 RepID=A0A2Z7BIK5_9LAMI|nr:hypothetical protein F511_04160 [Dorcoceras hygrometricum]
MLPHSTHTHSCTLLHSAYIFSRFCSRTLPDLSIGEASRTYFRRPQTDYLWLQTSRRSTNQPPIARRFRAPRRGGMCSSAEIIWLHQLAPSVGNVEGRQDVTKEE